MVEKFKLQLASREAIKSNALRRDGKIPATLYGPGEDSMSVQVNAREFSKLPPAAYSHIVELQGLSKGSVNALIRHVQRDHRNHAVLNIEFYRVAKDRKLTVTVPLKFVGTSSAVQKGGIFQPNFDECNLECLPDDIPDFIEVDISAITELDHGLHFSEIKLGKGITILNPAEEIVCRVVTPKKEEAAAAAAPAAAPAAEKKEEKKEEKK